MSPFGAKRIPPLQPVPERKVLTMEISHDLPLRFSQKCRRTCVNGEWIYSPCTLEIRSERSISASDVVTMLESFHDFVSEHDIVTEQAK